MKLTILLSAGAIALASVAAFAQMQHPDTPTHRMGPPMQPGAGMHHGMQMHGGMPGHGATQPKGDNGPASLAFQGINAKMHEAMNITYTGNADVDFVKGMIPHHQGAIDMAKTVLAFGKDPEVRKLAEEIIKAQESEIAMMNAWLKARGQ
jgi:uncharacterized protein (DUF305 family)